MADFRLGAGNDIYTEPDSDRNDWNHYFGEAGDDTIRFYQGQAVGGPGNDRIERLIYGNETWRSAFAAYWDSPSGVTVDLAAGTADDGYGTRDTLIGIDHVSGSTHVDRLAGNERNNDFNTQGGSDIIDGRGGSDSVTLWHRASDRFRPARIDEVEVRVTPDGRQATIRMLNGLFTISTTDVETLNVWDGVLNANGNLNTLPFRITDFITPQSLAEQAIAAGGSARWNASQPLGSAVNVSYSFVTQSSQPGFRAFTAAEQQIVREILAGTAAITQLTFSEVAESPGSAGQMRFGVSQQGATKGTAHMPGEGGEQAGDVWMDVDSMLGLAPGSEGYQALLHEIGHALGLRHPRNVDAGDAWSVQMRPQDDRLSMTVMSQQPSPDGLFRADWGLLDLLALRYLYGTRPARLADNVYRIGERESAAMSTIVDDGGNDTIDASASPAGVTLDLRPGSLVSTGITPGGFGGVENLALAGAAPIENAVGSAHDDVLTGNTDANTLTGGAGNDWIDGGGGTDTAVFAGKRADYELSNAYGKTYVEARDGTSGFDTLVDIERLQFADQVVALSRTIVSSDAGFVVDEDAALSGLLPDPSDVARGSVTYSLVAQPAHGSATVSADGRLAYRPAADFWGQDVVTWQITSGPQSNRYVAFVQVEPVNDGPPVIPSLNGNARPMLMPGGVTVSTTLPVARDPDGDAVSYSLVSGNRNVEVTVTAGGTFTYRSAAGFRGDDAFSFVVADGRGGSNVYTLNLSVVPVASVIAGSAADDVLTGGAAAEGFVGGAGNDRFSSGAGDDVINGGAGVDTVVYAGPRSAYRFETAAYGWTVEHTPGVTGRDAVAGVERFVFADTAIAFDLDGNAGAVAQILRGVFGKSYLSNKLFVGIGLALFDGGMGYDEVIRAALDTDLFVSLAGDRSNEALVNLLYRNVIGHAPTLDETAAYAGLIASGAFTREALAMAACRFSPNAESPEIIGLATTGLEFTPFG